MHSADDWEELLISEIEQQQKLGNEVVFRADAAFAKPEIYEALEKRGVKYAIRIPANDSLERDTAELLTQPVGRPSHKPLVWYKGFLYQAASWKDSATGGGQCGVPFWGVVSESGIHRNQPGDTKPGGDALLQQAGDGGAVDQGGQADGKDDAAFLSSFALQPGAAGIEPAGLQSGQFVAAAVTARRNRELVAREFAAAVGENRGTAGKTCQVLLADAGGRTSGPTAVRGHAGLYGPAAGASGIDAQGWDLTGVSSSNLFQLQCPLLACCQNRALIEAISRTAASFENIWEN